MKPYDILPPQLKLILKMLIFRKTERKSPSAVAEAEATEGLRCNCGFHSGAVQPGAESSFQKALALQHFPL